GAGPKTPRPAVASPPRGAALSDIGTAASHGRRRVRSSASAASAGKVNCRNALLPHEALARRFPPPPARAAGLGPCLHGRAGHRTTTADGDRSMDTLLRDLRYGARVL